MNNLGVVAAVRGHNRQAIRYWHQALKIGREIGYSARLSAVQVNIGVKYFESGKLQDAEISYLQGLDYLRRAEKITDQIYCLGNLSELQLCHANYRASYYYNTAARDLATSAESAELQFQPLLQLAELHCRTGNHDIAYETLLAAERLSPDPSDIDRLRIASMKNACHPNTEPAIDLSESIASGDWERIDEATLILWWLQNRNPDESSEFTLFAQRLHALGIEAQHLWIESWGKYYSLLAASTTTAADWENSVRNVTQFPEIHWRVLWKAGNAWRSVGEHVSARNSFRKAIQILKQITSQLHSGEAATYLKASDPSRFRLDMTAQ
ncbi:MAG: hypothetical protein OEM52_14645 [bacterium]|nr:hypothetical protein [bacterium]